MPAILFWVLKFIPGFSTLSNLFAQWLTNQGNTRLAQIGADRDVAIAELAAQTAATQAKVAVLSPVDVKTFEGEMCPQPPITAYWGANFKEWIGTDETYRDDAQFKGWFPCPE